jgi:hypothetical protein
MKKPTLRTTSEKPLDRRQLGRVHGGVALYVPTLMPDRGFLPNDDSHPTSP